MPPKAGATSVAKTPRRQPRPITLDYVHALAAYADLLYKGGLVPTSKKGEPRRPETIAALIEVGRDVGLPATQAVAWIMIVNGRPSIWGDAAMALILSSGLLEDRAEHYEGTPGEDDYTAVFTVKRVGTKEPRVTRFSVADAKRADLWSKPGPWQTHPERQLMWRAKGFGCRDEFPDVLCGLVFVEEALDIPDPTGRVTVEQAAPAAIPAATATDVRVAPESSPAEAMAAAVTHSAAAEQEAMRVTDDQLERLAELRDSMMTAKGLTGDDAEDAAAAEWIATLKPFGVQSARDLNARQASDLIEQLGKQHDPFTHPPAHPTPAT